eukprot:sb/3473424/
MYYQVLQSDTGLPWRHSHLVRSPHIWGSHQVSMSPTVYQDARREGSGFCSFEVNCRGHWSQNFEIPHFPSLTTLCVWDPIPKDYGCTDREVYPPDKSKLGLWPPIISYIMLIAHVLYVVRYTSAKFLSSARLAHNALKLQSLIISYLWRPL